MQRRISNEVQHGSTVSLFDMTCQSSPIDRSASNFLNKSGKVGKIESLRNSGEYDANLAKYIPGMLNLVYQGIIENIDTKRASRAHFLQGYGNIRISNHAYKQMLYEPKQHSYLFSHKNQKRLQTKQLT